MRLVERIELENGLVLELYDYSRVVAGDRWFVGLLCQISVPILDEVFSLKKEWEGLRDEFRAKYGDRINFEMRKERNFIDEKEKDKVFEELLNQVKRHCVRYMGHKNFALGYLKRQVEEFHKRQSWWKD